MGFRIPEQGKEEIHARIESSGAGSKRPKTTAAEFDDYYLLVMLGISSGMGLPEEDADEGILGDCREFRQQWAAPHDYKPVYHSLVGLVISVRMEEIGIDTKDPKVVNDYLQTMLSEKEEDPFTTQYFQCINNFANAGAKYIRYIPRQKMEWEIFIQDYYNPLCKALLNDGRPDGKEVEKLKDLWTMQEEMASSSEEE